MNQRKSLFFVLAVLFLVTCTTASVFGAEIVIGAGAAPSNIIIKPIKEPFEKSTGIKLNLIESGPKVAMQDLLKGEIDVAGVGLGMKEYMDMLKKEGVTVDESKLKGYVVGKTRAVALLHKDNPITKLTKEQLKDIFSGKISNWKDVGGKDLPIVVVIGKLIPGQVSLFTNKALDGIKILSNAKEATTAPNVKEIVASTPGAIGIAVPAVADSSVKIPEQPEATSDITLVTKGDASPAIQKLIDFINGEGQKYIKK